MKCENPKHEGENPPILTGKEKGYWWLKDPEWLYWCPRCTGEWWKKQFKKVMEGGNNGRTKTKNNKKI